MPRAHARLAAAPWWQGALISFKPDARRWLRVKFPGLRLQHGDLVAEAVAQLTQQLITRKADAPTGWLAPALLSIDDIRRFHRLAYTVLSRQVTDEFRRHTTPWVQSRRCARMGSAGQYQPGCLHPDGPEPRRAGPDRSHANAESA